MPATFTLTFTCGGELTGRLACEVPPTGPARVEVVLAGPVVGPGCVVVRDAALPRPPAPSAALRGEGLWLEAVCETPGEHWSFGLEAFGLRVEVTPDELGVLDDDALRGDRVPVGAELEWETGGRVHGELAVGARRIRVDGTGELSVAGAALR